MAQYINKDILLKAIEAKRNGLIALMNQIPYASNYPIWSSNVDLLDEVKRGIDTLEVKDPYKQIVQYDSIKAGIQAHAETYSFNIESELFNQLTKEQQKLWRKEIEQACISGGEMGIELARDTRYKDTLEVKEVDLEKALDDYVYQEGLVNCYEIAPIAKYFFELGLKVQKGE